MRYVWTPCYGMWSSIETVRQHCPLHTTKSSFMTSTLTLTSHLPLGLPTGLWRGIFHPSLMHKCISYCTSLGVSEGSRKLRLAEGAEVFSPVQLPPFPSRYSWFLFQAEWNRAMVWSEGLYQNDTIGNRTRDLPTWSAVPQPTAPSRTPVRVLSVSAFKNSFF